MPTSMVGDMDDKDIKPDLKRVLMQLGNILVFEHKFMPAAHKGYGIPAEFADPRTKATHLIAELTEFLNEHEEARQVLSELGYDWSMPKKRKKK